MCYSIHNVTWFFNVKSRAYWLLMRVANKAGLVNRVYYGFFHLQLAEGTPSCIQTILLLWKTARMFITHTKFHLSAVFCHLPILFSRSNKLTADEHVTWADYRLTNAYCQLLIPTAQFNLTNGLTARVTYTQPMTVDRISLNDHFLCHVVSTLNLSNVFLICVGLTTACLIQISIEVYYYLMS